MSELATLVAEVQVSMPSCINSWLFVRRNHLKPVSIFGPWFILADDAPGLRKAPGLMFPGRRHTLSL